MLNRPPLTEGTSARRLRHERRLWHDGLRYPQALGCTVCPEQNVCGGLNVLAGGWSCLDHCCGEPTTCHAVCRKNPDFVDRVREIGSFGFDNVPRARVLSPPSLPVVIPVIYHGKCREKSFTPAAVALPLYALFSRADGKPRFASREALCAAFKLASDISIVLTGTDQDPPLERWWGLGDRRLEIMRAMRALNIALVTTPNYSLLADRPRWDDLHSMKRIALVHQEFLNSGLPTALHVNARTDMDWLRWTDYISHRPEVTYLAYEFATGAGRVERREWHAKQLAGLAESVGRPLHLVVRGGLNVLPILRRSFTHVSILETSIFMKTIYRQRAIVSRSGKVTWEAVRTDVGTPLDALLRENFEALEQCFDGAAVCDVGISSGHQ